MTTYHSSLSTTLSEQALILSIDEARLLLGDEAIGRSNDEILEIIANVDWLATLAIEAYKVHNSTKKNNYKEPLSEGIK